MREDYFTRKMFVRQFLPAVISAVVLAVGDMADALVLGNQMGVTGLAAISLTLPVFMIINVIMHGFGTGGSVYFANQLAMGNQEKALESFHGVMLGALAAGIAMAVLGNLFLDPLLWLLGAAVEGGAVYEASRTYVRLIITAAPLFFCTYILNYYLRNDDKEKLASLGSALGNVADVLLNILFVLVLRMGVKGAALATILGLVISLAVYLTGFFGKKGVLQIMPFHPDWKLGFHLLKNGFATSSQYLFSMLFLLTANHLLLQIDGSRSVAVFEMVQNVSFLLMYIYDATARALQPILSTYFGERNREGCQKALCFGLFWGSAVGLAVILLIFFLPHAVCGVFGISEKENLELGIWALRIYVCGMLFGGINIILEGYFQSTGYEKGALLVSFLRGTAFLIPLMIFFGRKGTEWFWAAFPAAECLSLAVVWICCSMDKRKKDSLDEERVYHRTISSSNEDLAPLLEEIEEFCSRWESTVKQQYFMNMTVEELCVAIMEHAFRAENGYIQLTLIAHENGEFELHIRDNAMSFNPFEMESSDEEMQMDICGVLVIKKKAKEFFYRRYQGFNTLVVKI